MIGYPKLVGQFLDAGKNSQKWKQYLFYLKLNRKDGFGILEKKTQGEKFHELKNLKPCIILDFSKLVWPILATTKMWAPFEIQIHFELGPLFLKVAKKIDEDENPCQDKRNG